jgi:transposase
VVAPSLVWQQPGEKRKNDPRDARKLVVQLAAGQLTEVHPPTPAQEALRELLRDREDAQMAAKRLKQQLGAMLLCYGVEPPAQAWSQAYRQWLKKVRLDEADAQYVLEDRLLALAQAEQRVKALDERIAEAAKREEHREAVGRLCCFRGVDTLTAMVFLAELYEFGRFGSPRALMGYLGLVPGERSSGERERSGGLTKAGKAAVRRVLIEAAKHYRHRPAVGKTMLRRQAGQPPAAVAAAQTAMNRLHRRYWRLVERGKQPNVATAAVARELAGFLWAVLQDSPAAA